MSIEGRLESAPKIEIELQQLSLEDIDRYLEIEKRVESKTYLAAQNREEAEEEFALGPMYFIKLRDQVVGAVSYSKQEDGSVYVNGLAIDPLFQRQGLGREVLTQILEQVKLAPRVWLVTHPDNGSAVSLYESFDFKITDRIEDFEGSGEPRIVLTRDQPTHNTH